MKRVLLLLFLMLGFACASRAQYTQVVAGGVLPLFCTPTDGDLFFLNSAIPGSFYYCSAVNTWSAIGTGSGSGVGPGTVNFLPKFTSATTIGNSTCIDDGTNPTTCPNGVSTALQGNYDYWTVDTGNVTANKLGCRSSNFKIVICPTSTTAGVLGVAFTTQTSGNTVQVCWAAHCLVTATNATTAGHWLIPSTSVAGNVDDTGSTTEPVGTQTFLAESSVSAGQLVSVTILSPDTVGANTISNKITTVEVNAVASGTIANFNNTSPAASVGFVDTQWQMNTVSGNSSISAQYSQAIPINAQTGTSYAINGLTDRISLLTLNNASPVAVTIGQAGTGNFVNNFAGGFFNLGAGLTTITPSTSTINGNASQIVPQNWFGFIYSDNVNYRAPVLPSLSAFPNCPDTGGQHLNITAATGAFACGTSGSGTSGYNQILSNGTSVTQRQTVNFIPAGSANVSCVDNSGATRTDCTVTGINGPPSPTVNYISNSPYNVQNSDNSWWDANSGGLKTYNLPQAGQVGTSPYIGHKYGAAQSCTNCATTAFSQSSGDMLFVTVGWDSGSVVVNSVSDTNGDTFNLVNQTNNIGSGPRNLATYRALNITATGSNTLTVHMSGAATVGVDVQEYSVLQTDNAVNNHSNTINTTVTLPLSFTNVVVIGVGYSTGNGACGNSGSGWVQRGNISTSGGSQVYVCERVLSSISSVIYAPFSNADSGGELVVATDYAISATPLFTSGWFFTPTSSSSTGTPTDNIITVTPTTSTINTRSSLQIPQNSWCTLMSDNTNYQAICGFIPNETVNGLIGGPVDICSDQTGCLNNNTASDVTTRNIVSTGANAAFYQIVANITCKSSVAGTETLTIGYTDTSGTAQTLTASANCTTLGASSVGSIVQAIRANGGTNITYATSHTSSQPTYDTAVSVLMLHTF